MTWKKMVDKDSRYLRLNKNISFSSALLLSVLCKPTFTDVIAFATRCIAYRTGIVHRPFCR